MIRTIAGFSVRRPLLVIVVWVAVVGAGFGVGVGVFERLVPDVGAVPGSESDRAEELLAEAAPDPDTLTAVVADSAAHDDLAAAATDVQALPGVDGVSEPQRSAAGDALLLQVTLAEQGDPAAAAENAAQRLREVDGLVVAGGPLTDEEFGGQAQEDVATAELVSMPVVLVLLLLIFGGLLAAGLPLLIAGVGIGAAFGILYTFSLASDVSVYAVQVATMLSVGLAVDYALLMVSRFREERRTAPDVPTAVARTAATAGRTVLFSGLTVAVALVGLMVFNDPFLRSMGLAGAAVVAVDMVAALTLLPALLARFGHRIRPAKPRTAGQGVFARVARVVQRRPVLTLVITGGVMATLALPVAGMQLSGGDPRMLPASTDTRAMWDELDAHFPDQTAPADILAVAETDVDDPAVARLRDRVAQLPEVGEVAVTPAGPDVTVLRATPEVPPEDAASRELVTNIRALPAPFEVMVTGDAAALVDYREMLGQRLPWAAGIVLLATLLLLFAFTGSVVLPVKAILTSLLSIGAALGVVVWMFQQGNLAWLVGAEGLGYVHLTVPVLVGAIAFGLSVDYEVFLLSRIRERWLAGADARASVAEGLQHTGRVVTAAALVIGVVFAGFVLGGFAPIKAIGVGLVLAIALDATVVRMLLVPATMTLLGRRNWWLPGPLRSLHQRLTLADEST